MTLIDVVWLDFGRNFCQKFLTRKVFKEIKLLWDSTALTLIKRLLKDKK